MTTSEAANEVGFAISGGLTKTQLHYEWQKVFGTGRAGPEGVRELLRTLIKKYPHLVVEALELAFTNYSDSPDARSSWLSVRDRVEADLRGPWDTIESVHSGMSDDDIEELVEQQVNFIRMPRDGEMSLKKFTSIFQHDVGPSIATRLVASKYNASILEDLGEQCKGKLQPSRSMSRAA